MDAVVSISGDDPQQEELAHLRTENEQLRHALESRIVIEQAKGVLAGRHALDLDDAFYALRRAARSSRLRLHDIARDVVVSPGTPQPVLDQLERRER